MNLKLHTCLSVILAALPGVPKADHLLDDIMSGTKPYMAPATIRGRSLILSLVVKDYFSKNSSSACCQ